MQKEKVFLFITNSYIGDILLLNSLVQNIKRIYTSSKIVLLTNKSSYDIAKYQTLVDDVIIWDRHQSFIKTLNFIIQFPYKKIFAAFPMYASDKFILISFLLRAKYILFHNKNNIFKIFKKKKYKIKNNTESVQLSQLNLLSGITKEKLINVPIMYNPPITHSKLLDDIKVHRGNYIGLCCISSRKDKDMPIDLVYNIINKFLDKQILILGCGKQAEDLIKKLKEKKYNNIINLVNKTNLIELANYLKNISGLISVDTGTMHLACAVQCPVVSIFYLNRDGYKPDEKMYKIKNLNKNCSIDEIIENFNKICKN